MKEDYNINDFYLPVYIVNWKDRIDRKQHILEQFKDKPEFQVTLIEPTKHPIGAVGLWQSLVKAVEISFEGDDDLMVFCEDDHIFTSYYNKEYLFSCIPYTKTVFWEKS